MSTTIESLELQIQSSSQSATSGLDALSTSLEKLKAATKGGVGLTAVVNQMNKLNSSLNSISSINTLNLKDLVNGLQGLKSLQGVKISSTIASSIAAIGEATKSLDIDGVILLGEIAPALSSLSSLGDIKISSTIGTGISAITSAVKGINVSELSKIAELAYAVSSLASIRDVKISSTIAKQVIDLGIAAEQLQGIDLSVFGNLAEALVPLSTIQRANLTSTINQLNKFPDMVQNLNSVDLDAFRDRVTQLTSVLQPLATQMNAISSGFAAFPQRIQQVITGMNGLSSSNTRAASSYVNLYARVRMAITAVRSIARVIASWITKANEYIEDLNLFNASMGSYAREAQAYAERVGEIMGIDPGAWMRNQGIFMTLATGFGVAGDRAYTMSQQLTQLGYDLSSFFNIAVDDAMQKLQSGISGELEPLRRLGYDLSQARLKAIALSLGIDKTFNSMTQAEKAQLRYYAIMTQVTTAQGDMARTLDAPANQLRILKAQVEQAARAFGSVFIPILNAVLPFLIACAKAVRILAAAIASLFGFSLPDVDYSGITDYTGGVGDLGDALDSAGGSAKKLKSYLMGFDELNIIDPSTSAGGGGGGGGGGGDWDWDLPVYDFLGNAISTRVDEWMKKFQPTLDFVKEHLDEILSIAEAIGAAFLIWKIAKALIPDLGLIRTDLKDIISVAVAAATITIMATLVYKFDTKFMETGAFGYLIADGLTTALSGFIVGKVIKNAFGAGAGQYAAAATLVISTGTTIKAIYDHVIQSGFDGNTVVTAIWAAIKGAAAGGLLALAMGASVVGGIAVGAIATLGIGIVVALIASEVRQSLMDKAIMWGKITLSATEIKAYAEEMFSFDVTPRINLLSGVIENAATAKAALSTATELFNASLKRVEIGAQIDPELTATLTEQLTGEKGLIPNLKAALKESQNQLTVTLGVIPPKDTNGEDMSVASMIGNIISADKLIEAGVDDLGEQMGKLLIKGASEGLSNSEGQLLSSIQQTLTRVSLALTTGGISGGFSATIDLKLSDLSQQSFIGVITEYQGLVADLQKTYSDALISAQSEMEGRLKAAQELRAEYARQGNQDMVDSLDITIAQLEGDLANLDVAGSLEAAMNSDTELAKQKMIEGFHQIFDGATSTLLEERPFQDLILDFEHNLFDPEKDDPTEWADGIKKRIEAAIKSAVGDENYEKVVLPMEQMFNMQGWDLLSSEMQLQLYDTLEDGFGSEGALKILNQLGYDLTGALSAGITNATSIIEDDAGNIVMTLKDGTKVALAKNDSTIAAMFKSLGCDIVDGMVVGIDGQMSDQAKALADLFGIPYTEAADELGVHSPSTVFETLGGYIVDGLILGLKNLARRLGEVWTELPSWAQGILNLIASLFSGTNFTSLGTDAANGLRTGLDSVDMTVETPIELIKRGWETVTKWINLFFGDTDNDERINLLKNGWETVTKWIHSLFGNTDNDEKVSLLRQGWETVSLWVNSLLGNTDVKKPIGLTLFNGLLSVASWLINNMMGGDVTKSIGVTNSGLWSTIASWITGNKMGGSVTKSIGLSLFSSFATVAAWLLTNAIIGGAVNKEVNLVKGTWIDFPTSGTVNTTVNLVKGNWAGETVAGWCADGSSLNVKVSLVKNGWSSLSGWISSSWSKNFTVGLSKGSAVTWSGRLTTSGTTARISFYKGGGFPNNGEMFIAREAGPELVGSIGGKTSVANNDQIVESVSEGVYAAVLAAMSGSDNGDETRIVVNLDGEKIYENQQKIARNRGYNMGMGAFSFG